MQYINSAMHDARHMKHLKRLRIARGVTQVQLAALMGTTQPAISKWESPRVSVSKVTRERLAKALKCRPEEL